MTRARTILALAIPAALLLTAPRAAAQAPKPAWQLVEIVDYKDQPADKEYRLSYVRGTIGWRWAMNKDAWQFQSTWTPPPQTIAPGDRVTVTFWVLVNEDAGHDYSAGGTFSVFFDQPDVAPGFAIAPIGFGNDEGEGGGVEVRHRAKNPPIERTVWVDAGKLPAGRPGARIALLAVAYNGRTAGTKYVYEWRAPLTAAEKKALDPPTPPAPPPSSRASAGAPPTPGLRDSGARFSSMTGEVEVFHAGQGRKDAEFAKLDTILYVGDHIVVGEEGSAIVGFSDLSTHLLKEESEVVITTSPDKDSKIGLVLGTMWTNVKKMWKDGTMEVEMWDAAASVKGTTFLCETSPRGSTITVFEGTVEVRSTKRTQHATLEAGTTVSSAAGVLGRVRPFSGSADPALWGPTDANLALGRRATQSSTGFNGAAGRAVDGNTNGAFPRGSVTHTGNGPREWWQVDLGASSAIDRVVIWNRTDCCGERLASFWVLVSDDPFPPGPAPTGPGDATTWRRQLAGAAGPRTEVAVGARGRYVRLQLAGQDYLSLAEVEVIGR